MREKEAWSRITHHHPDGELVVCLVQGREAWLQPMGSQRVRHDWATEQHQQQQLVQDATYHSSHPLHHSETEPDLSCCRLEWSLWKGSDCSWWRVRWWETRSILVFRKSPVLFSPFSASEPDCWLPGILNLLCHHCHLLTHPAGSQISSKLPLPPLLFL